MSIFDSLGSQPKQQQMSPGQALQQLKANPAQVLKDRGISIPVGMTNPQQIVQHLVQSGQVPQSRLAQAMQMAQRFVGGSAR